MPKKQTVVTVPDWLDADLWAEFLAHRKTLKKPMTDYAQALAFKLLERIRAAGHDPRASIEQSIFNGWQGLFEPRDVEIKSATQTDYQRTQARARADDEREAAIDPAERAELARQARERAQQIKRDRLTH